jgi:hypothetical protein
VRLNVGDALLVAVVLGASSAAAVAAFSLKVFFPFKVSGRAKTMNSHVMPEYSPLVAVV